MPGAVAEEAKAERPSGDREDSDPPRQQRPLHRYRALAAVTVVPMAGELATCADVWAFSRPARPDDRRHYLEAPVDG